MNNLLMQMKEQIQAVWGRLTGQQKLILIGSLTLLFSALIYFVTVSSKTEYVTVVTKADPKEVGEMMAKLQESKITSQSIESGTGLQVPINEKDTAIAALATAGYPKGSGASIGFESLTTSSLGETDKDKTLKYRLALQGELERTLRSFKGVDRARVQIVPAEQSLFVEKETSASASVFLEMAGTDTLDQNTVKGIIHLIAKSVQNLKPQDVTVVDNYGNTLSEGLFDDPANLVNNQQLKNLYQIRREMEKDIERKVTELMAKVVGRGKAMVKATVELNQSNAERKDTLYPDDPKPKVVSRQNEEETSTGGSQGATPGTDTNIPGYQQNTGQSNGSYSRNKSTENFMVSSSETTTQTPPGEIKRLTVAVILGKEMDQTALTNLEKAVRDAANINQNRGDSVSISAMAFNEDDANAEQALKDAEAAALRNWIIAGIVAAVLAGVGLFFYLKKRQKKQGALKEEEYSVADMMPEPDPVELSPEELEKLALREQIDGLVDKNPEAVAKLLKTWISDEGR